MKADRRAYPRVDTQLPVQLQGNAGQAVRGTTIDISRVGVSGAFEAAHLGALVPPGGQARGHVFRGALVLRRGPSGQDVVRFRGRLVHAEKLEDGRRRLGLHFLEFEPGGYERLEAFVMESMAY
jgi:c-di-GMP-binding flagellar brake protein YcgR